MSKRYLITGVLVWVPVLVTVMVIRFGLRMMTHVADLWPMQWLPIELTALMPIVSLLAVIGLVWLTGLLTSNVLGRWILARSERLLARIPLIRSVYQGVKQAMSVVFSADSKQRFSRVVLIEYPRKGVWSLAFVTNESIPELSGMLTVFVPTTPNPTSGFILMLPEKDVKPSELGIDEALKYIISLGTVLPEQQGNNDA